MIQKYNRDFVRLDMRVLMQNGVHASSFNLVSRFRMVLVVHLVHPLFRLMKSTGCGASSGKVPALCLSKLTPAGLVLAAA
jgi:hypothetical protein